MKTCILGIDVGGTNVKAITYDAEFNQLSSAKFSTYSAYKVINGERKITGPQRNFDGDKLWSIVSEVVGTAVAGLPVEYEVSTLSVSSCGCTVFFIDEKGKQIDINMSQEELEQEVTYYESLYSRKEFFAKTGYPLGHDMTGIHMSAFCKNNEMRPRSVLSVDDYIVYRLSGMLIRNFSTACSCGMWDWTENRWLEDFVRRSGLSTDSLGEPVDSGQVVGAVSPDAATRCGLSSEVLVVTGGHDYECAALALGTSLGDNLINITGTIDLIASFSRYDAQKKIFDYRYMRDMHVTPGFSSTMVESFGAIQAEWFKDLLLVYGHPKSFSWKTLYSELWNKETFHDLVFIPKVFGSTFPKLDHLSKGAFLGLDHTVEPTDFIRAINEGISFQTRSMLEEVWGQEVHNKRLFLIGGANRDNEAVQLKADILGCEIVVPDFVEASALGAAILAGIGSKIFNSWGEAMKIVGNRKTFRFTPDEARAKFFDEVYITIWQPAERAIKRMDNNKRKINLKYYGSENSEKN